MNHSLRLFAIAGAILLAASCGPAKTLTTNTAGFPLVDQGGKIAIVAHRGFWKSEQGGMSENSIASLRAAQDAGLWGSECDIHLTADGIVIVNHDPSIAGKSIRTHNYSDFAQDLLPNGEHRPTLDEYLVQTSKCKTTKLVIEFKKQGSDAVEDELVDKTIAEIGRAHV